MVVRVWHLGKHRKQSIDIQDTAYSICFRQLRMNYERDARENEVIKYKIEKIINKITFINIEYFIEFQR